MPSRSLKITAVEEPRKTATRMKRNASKHITADLKKKTPKKKVHTSAKNRSSKTKTAVVVTASTSTPETANRKKIHARREPLGHLLFEKLLRESGFKGGISSNKTTLNIYSTDESIFSVRPQVVLEPINQSDVEKAVSLVAKETLRFDSLSLTPRAAGTGLGGGSLTDSLVIDVCTHMHRIQGIEKTKDGVTVTCQPGAMWRDVERRLRSHGVYIPSYPASKDICSIGGSVANNAAGPNSLRYGHTANWVLSVDATLYDGKTYTIKPLSYKEYKALIKKKNVYARIAQDVFSLIEANEKVIHEGKPKTSKNSAGYALWDVFDTSVASFKKGKGTMNLCKLICGSQGTIGILTSITLKTIPIEKHTELIAVPVFDLNDASKLILKALDENPLNIELFDGLTFDLALQNPTFFKKHLSTVAYYRVLVALYTTYHVRYARKIPEFTLLITLDPDGKKHNSKRILDTLRRNGGKKARLVQNSAEKEMLWQIRRGSYSLSKHLDKNKRPAAFLEDMVVPAKQMPKFFMEIKRLLKKYNVTAAVHGHGGDGHLHFYPLLDFENKTTPQLIMRMTEEFFAVAMKHGGDLCGEHNDGIIRTPYLSKMFSARMLSLFERIENIFDPSDIFNPGKKVNPRYDIRSLIRTTNETVSSKHFDGF